MADTFIGDRHSTKSGFVIHAELEDGDTKYYSLHGLVDNIEDATFFGTQAPDLVKEFREKTLHRDRYGAINAVIIPVEKVTHTKYRIRDDEE